MKLQGYLIEKFNNMGDAYTCRRLLEEAKRRDVGLTMVGVHDTFLHDGEVYNDGHALEPRDFVINRYKWGCVKDGINSLAQRSYNALDAFNIYVSKYEQLRRLTLSGIYVPKYLLGTALMDYQIPARRLGVPFVAKGLKSSMGIQVFLIKDENDYLELRKKSGTEKEWIFQEFISESRGRDLRLYSVRGNVAAAMIRSSRDDFRANVALGAKVEPCAVTEEMQRAAGEIYSQTGLDFLGIDLLFGKEGLCFCEINVMPGCEGMEEATGVNIAGLVIGTIAGDFER